MKRKLVGNLYASIVGISSEQYVNKYLLDVKGAFGLIHQKRVKRFVKNNAAIYVFCILAPNANISEVMVTKLEHFSIDNLKLLQALSKRKNTLHDQRIDVTHFS